MDIKAMTGEQIAETLGQLFSAIMRAQVDIQALNNELETRKLALEKKEE